MSNEPPLFLNSPRHNTYTNEDDEAALLSYSYSSKRANSQPIHPLSLFSLAGLRNIFFRQTVTLVPRRKSYGSIAILDRDNDDLESRSQSSDATEVGDDQSEDKNGGGWSKIDARIISDATIGLSDGLTVPFALTAGLSALGNTKVVIYGGFAELVAGAISMGLGGYLGAKSEIASYNCARAETENLVATSPTTVLQTLNSVFTPYALPPPLLTSLTTHLSSSPHLVEFLMSFHHNEKPPPANRAFTSALTIALAYFIGGLLPLTPYFFVDMVYTGLYLSIGVMVVALFAFGYCKTCVVEGWEGRGAVCRGCWGGVQMVVVGSAAAGAAMGLVRAFNSDGGGV